MADRYSEVDRLTRRTPAAASSGTENDLSRIPTMKFTGRRRAAHTLRTAGRSGKPGAKHERKRQLARRLRGSRHALDRVCEPVERRALIATRVLDRAAHQPGFRRQADGVCHDLRSSAKTVLQICGHRQRTYGRDEARVREGLGARDLAVESSERGSAR
jgi:hypothetical protein